MKDLEDFNRKIGQRIKDLRGIHSMTQMDLAYRLGYESTGMISQIENGLKGMSLSKLRKCAEIFNVPMSKLLDDKEYSKEDMETLKKFIEVLDSPPGNRHRHYEAIKLLLKDG